MLPFLCALIKLPEPVLLLVLAAMATQRSVVYAQSPSNGNGPYFYRWLTPGRIVGIALGLFLPFRCAV